MLTITPPEIHQRLAQARRAAGYATASDAARARGWNENTYRSHENGERGLKVDVAYTYAKAFKVRFEWLMIGVNAEGSIQTTESREISGWIDDDAIVHYYSTEPIGKFKPIVAVSSLISREPNEVYEVRSKRPVLGCWPGELISVSSVSDVIAKMRSFPNDKAIFKFDSRVDMLRMAQFNADKTEVNVQIYPEMPAEMEIFKDILMVEAIIRPGSWFCATMDDYQSVLTQAGHPWPREQPTRTP